MSWEFLFLLNLLIVPSLPLILKLLSRFSSRISWSLLFLLHALPYGLGISARFMEKQGDLVHYLKLVGLQWSLSWLAVLILWNLADPTKRLRSLYGVFAISAAVSVLGFLITPSLVVSDPIFGVVPGAFAMDAIIDTHFFMLRLEGLALALGIAVVLGFWIRWRSASFLALLWIVSLGLDQIRIGAFTLRPSFEREFDPPLQSKSLRIFVQANAELSPQAEAWLKELEFHEQEILQRLPITPLENRIFDIFIYQNDEAKYRATGARRVQIGNFLRGEMHLSSVHIFSEIIRHELVHLIHRHLDAPLISYVDPLQFEGLAVAVSAGSLQEALQEGAAITQSKRFSLSTWPTGLRFFSELPNQAAYALAGGLAAYQLQQGQLPWSATLPSIQTFQWIEVSPEQVKAADEYLRQPPLHRDPLARDCQRLFRDFRLTPTYRFWDEILRSSCPHHSLLYRAASLLPDRQSEALKIISRKFVEARGDLLLLDDLIEAARQVYRDPTCTSSTCSWKAQAIKAGKAQELRDLILQSKGDLKSILDLQKEDPQALASLISLQNPHDGLQSLQEVSQNRKLNPDELFAQLLREFYRNPTSWSSSEREQMLKRLEKMSPAISPKLRNTALVFESRLRFNE
jgi:hypothetical protein